MTQRKKIRRKDKLAAESNVNIAAAKITSFGVKSQKDIETVPIKYRNCSFRIVG